MPGRDYLEGPVNDPVSRLVRTKLQFRDGGLGYLPSLLECLGIRTDSQALVFATDSFQAEKISPRNPRAIYFSDDAAVGFVPGGTGIEIAALDPKQGTIFYTLDRDAAGEPRFTRQTVCLKCHQGPATSGVPGIFVGSVFPNVSGMPAREGAIITDHRTSFEDRWGGWYVNAAHGEQKDRANAVAPDPADPTALEVLTTRFNPARYLAPTSDIVALMTLEHQTQATNLITRIHWESRLPQREADIEPLVRYMTFADEVPLREPVEGVSSFTKTFPQHGPHDRKGRSLRDFDLRKRLFRYPLSYMVYSPAFDALPDTLRNRIYRRIFEVLTGDDRRAVLEIVRDTKTNLPAELCPDSGCLSDRGHF